MKEIYLRKCDARSSGVGSCLRFGTGQHKVAAVDAKTLRTFAKVGPINYPDGIAYAPGSKRIFVSDEHGDTDAVIEALNNELIKKIPLGGGAGNTVYDSTSNRILVAEGERSLDTQDTNAIFRI